MEAVTRVALRQHGAESLVGCAAHEASAAAQSRSGYEDEPGVESKPEQMNDSRPRKALSHCGASLRLHSGCESSCVSLASSGHGQMKMLFVL